MTDFNERNFTGLAGKYRNARPSYPLEMLREIQSVLPNVDAGLGASALDVGCGTGISTRLVAEVLPVNLKMLGVDSNEDMLEQARAEGSPAEAPIEYSQGNAEALPFENERMILVCAGQAVQWFDREVFYKEAKRLLINGGVIALFENNRDWSSSAFLDAHESFLEENSIRKNGQAYSRFYRDHPYAMELLRQFGNVQAKQFVWTREMTIASFIAMAESSTQVQRALERIGKDQGLAKIRGYCEEHADAEGKIQVPYVTELFMARK